MITRLIVFERSGGSRSHDLSLHHTSAHATELRLVFETATEHFDVWMFYFLRDHGAYIETTHPEAVAAALNLPPGALDGIVRLTA